MNSNKQDEEIDLSIIGQKISSFFDNIGKIVYNVLLFIKKNVIIISVLFIIGVVSGFFIDKNNDSYLSDIIVAPNFGSVDDLYTKIDLMQSRIVENDTIFWKQVGIKDVGKIKSIEIEPIIDVYGLINNNTASANNATNTQNFEMLKLLSEDSNLDKVMEEDLTSKRYSNFTIKIKSDGRVNDTKHIKPILNYLNNTEYYIKIRKELVNNIYIKMNENQIIINQINGLLDQFGKTTNNQKNDKLVYYNENNQLNDIINNKNNLIAENGGLRVQLVNLEMIIRPTSIVLNQKNSKGINGKMMLLLPVLLLFFFFMFSIIKNILNVFNKKYA